MAREEILPMDRWAFEQSLRALKKEIAERKKDIPESERLGRILDPRVDRPPQSKKREAEE